MSEEKPKTQTTEKAPPSPAKPGSSPGTGAGWFVLMILAGVLVVGVIVFRVISNRPKAAPVLPPAQVSTATVQQGDLGIYVEALGSVVSVATVTVPTQVSGQLIKVNFVEGQIVRSGDSLAEIDPRPFQAALDSAQGSLARDQALLAEARLDLDRYQKAYDQKAIPQQELDDQKALVAQDTGLVQYDQGQVDNAKVQLGFCHIASPVSGRVGLRMLDAGNIVSASSTNGLVVITQLQPITVIFSVAEDFLPQIQRQLDLGNHMTVQALDRAQQKVLATGSVLALDNLINQGTGTIRIRAIFTNQDNALFPNQFVNAKLLIDTLRGQKLVPASTVQRNGTNAYLYILSKSGTVETNSPRGGPAAMNPPSTNLVFTVEMRPVTLGITDGDNTAVEGVDPGEVLVADNFNRLQDKAKVIPRRSDEARKNRRG